MFPVRILYQLGEVSSFSNEFKDYLSSVNVNDHDLKDKRLRSHILLCYLMNASADVCNIMIENYRITRGSADPVVFSRLTTAERSNGANKTPRNAVSTDIISRAAFENKGFAAEVELNHDEPVTPASTLAHAPAAVSHSDQRIADHSPSEVHDNKSLPPNHQSQHAHYTQAGTLARETDERRKADYEQQMLKDIRFYGYISEDIGETMRIYSICSKPYRLFRAQQADLFVHVFSVSARRFFFDNCFTRDNMCFPEMAAIMMQEYGSDARNMQIKGTLETPRFRSFMEERGITDISEGLTKLVDYLNTLAPNFPKDFRTEAHKIDHLRHAVTECTEWSRIPIQSLTSNSYSFHKFVTALHESIQNLRQITLMNGGTSDLNTHHTLNAPNVTGHLRYGRNLRPINRNVRGGRHQRLPRHGFSHSVEDFKQVRALGICVKCKGRWKLGHRCEKDKVIQNVRNRIQNGDRFINIITDLIDCNEELPSDSSSHIIPDDTSTAALLAEFDSRFSLHGPTDAPTTDEDDPVSVMLHATLLD